MQQATIAGLLQFIGSQAADRPINHGSWQACAVGDYAREVLQHVIPLPDDSSGVRDYTRVHTDPVILALHQECGMKTIPQWARDLCIPQAEQYSLMELLTHLMGNSTYGELRQELEKSLGLVIPVPTAE